MASPYSKPPPLTLKELSDILAAHRQWERSGGKEGQEAKLSGANLEWLDLDGYDLSRLDFREANLARVKFGEALLEGTDFRAADLQDADLSKVRNLRGSQLAGADLSGATLPKDVEEFESLPHVNAAIKHTQTTFFTILLVCVFCWLAIAVTTDAGLLTNTIETSLPVINTKMNIAAFYLAAPLLLFCLYIYLQLYEQRLWEAIADLPAVFLDGRPLPHHLHPWLGSSLFWALSPRFRLQRPPLTRIQNLLFKFLERWAAPLTLFAMWWRALPAHDWLLTAPQIALLSPALAAGLILPQYAKSSLRLRPLLFDWQRIIEGACITAIAGAVAATFSFYAFAGWFSEQLRTDIKDDQPSPMISSLLRTLANRTCANLEEVEVSNKPVNWSGKVEDVKGANLKDKDLRHVRANMAFLVRADMRDAQLQGADLSSARLQDAKLKNAQLHGAILMFGELQGANLHDAELQETMLLSANLKKTVLDGAQVQGANFSGAEGLTPKQVKSACGWPLAHYPPETLSQLGLMKDHSSRLHWKNFSYYKLQKANFSGCDLTGFNLEGAQLHKASLLHANLKGTNLRKAQLQGAFLESAQLQGADFTGAQGLTKAQVRQANGWPLATYSLEFIRQLELPDNHPYRLSKKDLSGYNLKGAKFIGCELAGFNLKGAQLQKAKFWDAKGLTAEQVKSARGWPLVADYDKEMLKKLNLPNNHFMRLFESDLSCYNLKGVDFSDCELGGFDLRGASLGESDFRGADLSGADLRGAEGLTRKQLQSAIMDEHTKLPDEFKDLVPSGSP